ncbi:protease modulator HflC [Oceanicola sp. 502str15]|uniref:protease modulator HflC n=1 Tax=Oceanicola sp. 502str15 TaxID=2696061 RepID=UPI00273A6586|nr:SPFH domain-containing protein [Oceanicola sp. 502str15]MCO6382947.1 protease modulator HflC [Oceanicola sp. 502str15]
MNRLTYLIPVVAIALAALLSSIFIVDEREQVLVLRFGQIKQQRTEPGLYFKVPLFDDVVEYEDRILSIETPLIEVTPADDRRLVVDAFVLWRITDMVQFRQAIGIGDERAAQIQLNDILDGQIRAVLGAEGVTSSTILSPERTVLMDQIEDRVNDRASELGIEVVDVRLRQTNLPEQNFDATLKRMIAEREREAIDERARGQEAGQRVRAAADRTYSEIIAEANRDARIIQGQADAERNRIFAEAYGQDEEFFEFYRSLSAYEAAIHGGNTSMVMSPDSEFFNYLRSDGSEAGAAPAPVDEAAAAAARAANEAAIRAAEESAAETASEAEAVIEELPDTSVVGDGATGDSAAPAGDEAPATDGAAPEAAPEETAPEAPAPAETAPEEAPAEETGN